MEHFLGLSGQNYESGRLAQLAEHGVRKTIFKSTIMLFSVHIMFV